MLSFFSGKRAAGGGDGKKEEDANKKPRADTTEKDASGSWMFAESATGGGYSFRSGAEKDFKKAVDSKQEGLKILKEDPATWEGLWCFEQPGYVPNWTLIKRSAGFSPSDGDDFTWIHAKYSGIGPASFTDKFTDTVLRVYQQCDVTSNYKRIGRGEGLGDEPGLKLFGDIDPCDVQQRGIGDCWLMCSMSAVAEFDGLISRLFTPQELSKAGKYTIQLFDLKKQKWVEYAIDDRLQTDEDGGCLRFADLSPEKEVLYASCFSMSVCITCV
jgi:hypothetical protein